MKSSLFFLLFLSFTLLNGNETKVVAFYTKNIAKVSDTDVRIAIDKILEGGSRESGLNLVEVFPKSIDELLKGFEEKRYALITLNTYDCMQNYKRLKPNIGKVWTIAKDKEHPKERYLLLVKKGTQITDLVDKRVGYVRFNEMQRVYLEYITLSSVHMNGEMYFKHILRFATGSKAILQLFFNQVEGVVVSEHTYKTALELNPQLAQNLTILKSSDAMFPSIGLTISHKGEKGIEALYKRFVQNKEDIQNLSNILMLYKAEAIVAFSKEDLERVYNFYQDYSRLMQEYGGL